MMNVDTVRPSKVVLSFRETSQDDRLTFHFR